MKVNSNIPDPHFHVAGNATPHAAGSGNLTGELGSTGSESSVVQSDVARYSSQLAEVPVVRDEVIANAAAKLASGAYLTSESAEATAEAILERLG